MQTLSPSRIDCYLKCARHHFWRYEIGLTPEVDSLAFRFGKAMHAALAARCNGADYDVALAVGIGESNIEELDIAILAALLDGYYNTYQNEVIAKVHPEIEIKVPIKYNREFMGLTILDGLCELVDGRQGIIEHKTTSESLDSGSNYWETLKFNLQVAAYVDASRHTDWKVDCVLYDVIRKPSIRQKEIPVLDQNGVKIVQDVAGNRVYLDNGKPRQAADEKQGWMLKTKMETPEEFGLRLKEDIAARPEFYFARRELPILDSEIAEYHGLRDAVARQIAQARKEQQRYEKPEYAWPRCVGRFNCQGCDCANFCLQNISASVENIPSGMKLKERVG